MKEAILEQKKWMEIIVFGVVRINEGFSMDGLITRIHFEGPTAPLLKIIIWKTF